MITITINTGGFTIPIPVPDEQFCTEDQAKAVAASLGGSSSVQTALSPAMTLVASAGDNRGWWEINADPKLFPGAAGPIMAFRLLKMMSAGPGAWHLDPNGQPMWVVTPVPQPAPVPQPPTPNTFPGFPGSVPAVDPNAQMRADVARILAWAIRMGA